MISVVVYGRNDTHGYNPHKRVVLSLNCIAETLDHRDDEILFVDYNTPDDLPTFIEATADMLTAKARRLIRVLRVRPSAHRRFYDRTHLAAPEPVARNVAIRRSNPANRWILSTNTDMIFLPQGRLGSLSRLAAGLPDGHYHTPRFELPETLWESFDRRAPRAAMRRLARWGGDLHLEETVEVGAPHHVDAPGDCQLVLRRDLFAIDGLDESMLSGWHIDSNLPKRLTLLRGPVGRLDDRLKAFHCDHTRQATVTHGRDRIENDWGRYVDGVTEAALPSQRDAWGLPDEAVEEIGVRGDGAFGYLRALFKVLTPRPPDPAPYRHLKTAETYNDLRYAPEHMLPYLADALNPLPRGWSVSYAGCREETFKLFSDLWREMGFRGAILGGAAGRAAADLLIFEFGFASQDHGAAPAPGDVWPRSDMEALVWVRRAFHKAAADERERLAQGAAARRVLMINAVHNVFEPLLLSDMTFVHAPYGTRVRQGFILPGTRPPTADRRAATDWLRRRTGRAFPPPQSEMTTLEGWLRRLLEDEPSSPPRLTPAMTAAAASLRALLAFSGPDVGSPATAERRAAVDAALAAAQAGARLAAEIVVPVAPAGTAEAVAAGRALNAMASVGDWENPAWRAWAERAFGGPEACGLPRRGRWMWERAQFLHGLDRLGALGDGRRLLVTACAPDPLLALLSELADHTVTVDARVGDRPAPEGWIAPHELRRDSALSFARREDVPDEPFADAALAPQNALFNRGLPLLPDLLAWTARRLKIGGVLAFSAEILLNAAGPHAWLDVRWMEAFARSMAVRVGLEPAGPVDSSIDAATLDRYADAADEAEVQPLVMRSDGALHIVGLWFFVKRRDATAADWAGLQEDLLNLRLSRDGGAHGLLAAMGVAAAARRGADGTVAADAGDAAEHVLFGPYLRLAAGVYWLEMTAEATDGEDGAALVEALVGDRLLASRRFGAAELAAGPAILRFEVPVDRAVGGAAEDGAEFRVVRPAGASLTVRRLELRCAPADPPQVLRLPLLADLNTTALATREEDGSVRVDAAAPPGHALFGPYVRLSAGPYRLEARIDVEPAAAAPEASAPVDAAVPEAPPAQAVAVDVAINGDRVLGMATFSPERLAAGPAVLSFRVPENLALGGAEEGGAEVRVTHLGVCGLRIAAVDLLQPLGDEA